MPASAELRALLKKVGPLVAPSVNPEGKKPASTIREAKKYFGNKVELYVNAGKIENSASTLVKLKKGEIKILRKGISERCNIFCDI